MDDNNTQFSWQDDQQGNPRDPMNGMTVNGPDGRERGVVFDWDGDATFSEQVPAELGDVREFTALSLRACQGTRHPATVAHDGPLGFSVELEDQAGVVATIPIEPFGLLTPVYARLGLGPGSGWANEFSTVRIPLEVFRQQGVDLANVRAIRLQFGPAHGAQTGRIGLDDIYFDR